MTQQLIPKQKKMSNIVVIVIVAMLVNVFVRLRYLRKIKMLKIGNQLLIMQIKELIKENKQLKSQIQSVPKWEGKSTIPNENTK